MKVPVPTQINRKRHRMTEVDSGIVSRRVPLSRDIIMKKAVIRKATFPNAQNPMLPFAFLMIHSFIPNGK